jgi:hypothetical protein
VDGPKTGSASGAFLRRAGVVILTLWAAVTIAFFALRLAAGDPTDNLLAQGLASPEQAQALRESLGLDQPLALQYLAFLRGLARGDLGRSLFTQRPVTQTIADQAGATLQLAAAGLLVAAVLGASGDASAGLDEPVGVALPELRPGDGRSGRRDGRALAVGCHGPVRLAAGVPSFVTRRQPSPAGPRPWDRIIGGAGASPSVRPGREPARPLRL